MLWVEEVLGQIIMERRWDRIIRYENVEESRESTLNRVVQIFGICSKTGHFFVLFFFFSFHIFQRLLSVA